MRSAKPSIAELRAVCQPPELLARYSAEHWAGRLYGRKVSIYLTWAFVRAGVSANAITVGMIAVGAFSAWLFSVPSDTGPILAVLGIQLYLVLDCADGEVARWRGTTGATGIFLDRLGHYIVEAGILAAMGARAGYAGIDPGFFFYRGNELPFAWTALGLFAAVLHLIGKAETDLVHVARAKAGLSVVADDIETAAPRGAGLARARRLATLVPFYRLTGAVEASLIAYALILTGRELNQDVWVQGFVIGSVVMTALVALGHLVMILASNRLR